MFCGDADGTEGVLYQNLYKEILKAFVCSCSSFYWVYYILWYPKPSTSRAEI